MQLNALRIIPNACSNMHGPTTCMLVGARQAALPCLLPSAQCHACTAAAVIIVAQSSDWPGASCLPIGAMQDINTLPYPFTVVNSIGWVVYGYSVANPYIFPGPRFGQHMDITALVQRACSCTCMRVWWWWWCVCVCVCGWVVEVVGGGIKAVV